MAGLSGREPKVSNAKGLIYDQGIQWDLLVFTIALEKNKILPLAKDTNIHLSD